MKTLMTLVVSLSIAACQSTPKVPRQPTSQPTQTAMEGGGNNSASGTMSGTPATGGTDPRGAGDDAPSTPSTQQPQPEPTTAPQPTPLPQPIPPNPMPPPSDAGTNTGGAASGPNRGASPTPPSPR